jgi:DNA polymerase I
MNIDILQGTLRLPNTRNLTIAVDTEASGLFTDDGARLSVVSIAWREYSDDDIETRVYMFDQGEDTWIGPKLAQTRKKQPVQPDLFGNNQPDNLQLDEWLTLTRWLSRQRIVMHNAKYDLHILNAGLRGIGEGIDLQDQLIWDTMVTCPVLWPEHSAALKNTAQRLWGVQEREEERAVKRWLNATFPNRAPRYDCLPADLMVPYAGQDAELTLRLYERQQQDLEEDSRLAHRAKQETRLALLLYRMERRGVGWDTERAFEASDVCTERMKAARYRIPFEPTEKGAREYFYNKKPYGLGLKPTVTTPTGRPSVNKEVLRQMVASQIPGAAEYQEYGLYQTARQMWYMGWTNLVGDDNRLRCSFHQNKTQDQWGKDRGTTSGRLAVQRIQMHAIPHDYQLPPDLPSVRSLIRPTPGYVLVEMDLSQAEMRTAAGIAQCKPLLAGFERGEDAHDTTTRIMFHIDEQDPRWKEYRNIAKRLNFGMLYGAGVATIARQIEIFTGKSVTVNEVSTWLNTYRQTFPELGHASRAVQQRVEKDRWIELAGGKIRVFAPYEETHKAFNALIQGGVAECVKMWMLQVDQEHGQHAHLVNQIHDSLVVEIPIDGWESTANAMAVIGEHIFARQFHAPFRVDTKQWGH